MARSNRHDSDEETDFFEEYEEALKERVKSLKKIEDATDAKALIALSEKLTKTKFKMYDNFQKKAKKIVEEMDDVMRVFVAQELRDATPRTRALGGWDDQRLYVTRSALWGFPDYSTVRLADGQIEIYGRLRFGKSDLGVNQARIRNWLTDLKL